jgi:hypothetical protein
VVKDVKYTEAAGYGEYQSAPPVIRPECRREEKKEQEKADPKPQRLEKGQACQQGEQNDDNPPNPTAIGEQLRRSIGHTLPPGGLKK